MDELTQSNCQKLVSCTRWADFLTEDDCSIFEPYLQSKQVKAGDLLLKQGQTCREIGMVVKGAFRTYYLADDKEVNTNFVFENEFVVDYDSFLNEKPSRYFIEALEDGEVVTFDYKALAHAYAVSRNWERFGRLVAERSYSITAQRVESFLFNTATERYLQLMEQQPQVLSRVPLYHIASYLGIERESLSRLRKQLAGQRM